MKAFFILVRVKSLVCLAVCMLLGTQFTQLHAQVNPTLSVQGILKKSNGVAVDDGSYNIVFKIYTVAAGGSAIWMETQPDVEVSSGIYSATLGVIMPLTIPFDQLYYLGITVGSAELTPRVLLTSAPYALSLIGQSNKFPSSGIVKADSIVVAGGVLARGGAPGLNGVSKNGYAFSGNSGDKDSGVFSTGDGKVSLYANNTEVLAVTPTAVQSNTNLAVTGTVTTNGVVINNNGTVSYGAGLNDWRLVDVDNFTSGSDGWQVYDKITNSGQSMGWNNPSSLGASPTTDMGSFIGDVLLPTSNDHVLKKNFTVPGTFTQIKIKFRYYMIDTWGYGPNDRAWAAFSPDAAGNGLRVGWQLIPSFVSDANSDFNNGSTSFRTNASFYGQNDIPDSWIDVEMSAQANGTSFWVFIGAAVDMDAADERYAVGAVEIWVK